MEFRLDRRAGELTLGAAGLTTSRAGMRRGPGLVDSRRAAEGIHCRSKCDSGDIVRGAMEGYASRAKEGVADGSSRTLTSAVSRRENVGTDVTDVTAEAKVRRHAPS